MTLAGKGDVEPVRCEAIQAFADMCKAEYLNTKKKAMKLKNWRTKKLCRK